MSAFCFVSHSGRSLFYVLGSQLPSCEYLEIFVLLAHHSARDGGRELETRRRLWRKLVDEQGIMPGCAVSWVVPPALLLSVKCRHSRSLKSTWLFVDCDLTDLICLV